MLTLSVDDACTSDVRVAELAKKYGIPTTFYWSVEWHSLANSKGYEPLPYAVAFQIAGLFDIGSHSITHRHLTELSVEEAEYEIATSRTILERMFDTTVSKFCPPRGYTNPKLTEFTLYHYDSQRLTRGPNLVHIHPNSGANGNRHWLECIKNSDITHAWLHSWELDRYPEEWDNLEKFLKDYRGQATS